MLVNYHFRAIFHSIHYPPFYLKSLQNALEWIPSVNTNECKKATIDYLEVECNLIYDSLDQWSLKVQFLYLDFL